MAGRKERRRMRSSVGRLEIDVALLVVVIMNEVSLLCNGVFI